MGRSLRLPSSTSSPSRNTIVRNPSHLGSKLNGPSGSSATGLASIGATGGITGRSMPPVSRTCQCWFMGVRVVVQTEDAAPAGVERLGCLYHGQRQVHAVEHGTARAGIGGEFGVRQEVQGRVELLDRTRAGLLLGVERILDTADEEARLVDPSAQDALRRRAQLVADGLQHVSLPTPGRAARGR